MISFTPSLHSGFGTKMVMGTWDSCSTAVAITTRWWLDTANALGPQAPRSTLQGTLVMKTASHFWSPAVRRRRSVHADNTDAS